ncbi:MULTISPECIES: hypothetical protein, partial [Mesorhizobium]|uniref:hypothetical protein n=1 Tax=Mesorhizobium TaxID=68287 RepID=UPI0019D1ED8C
LEAAFFVARFVACNRGPSPRFESTPPDFEKIRWCDRDPADKFLMRSWVAESKSDFVVFVLFWRGETIRATT